MPSAGGDGPHHGLGRGRLRGGRAAADAGPALESGLSMAMAAAGTRGELVTGGAFSQELFTRAGRDASGRKTDAP